MLEKKQMGGKMEESRPPCNYSSTSYNTYAFSAIYHLVESESS
jgi:hypothetical protein